MTRKTSSTHRNLNKMPALERSISYLVNTQTKLRPAPFPSDIHAQLASLVDEPPTGKHWLYEIKLDGYRLIIFKKGKQIKILTRNQHNWACKFKMITDAISKLPFKNLIIDGELVALDKHNRTDFQLLQNTIDNHPENLIYYCFDIIYFDKFNLSTLPLLERKNILKLLIVNIDSDIIRYSECFFGSGKKIFKKACALGFEGIIAKKVDSLYTQKRDKNWLKIKCTHSQEFIIGGFIESNCRNYFRSLMLGTFNKNHELIYHGKVGSGFTQASLEEIYSQLLKYTTERTPFARLPDENKNAIWVKPLLVAQIEFTEWTKQGTLRHPVFKGMRIDKSANSIEVEAVKSPNHSAKISYKLSHPERIIYAEEKITKLDIAEYYDSVHSWILPYIKNRPLTLVRCPNDYRHCFYQKHIHTHFPSGIYGVKIPGKKNHGEYLYIKDREGLISLSQLGTIEIHPWESCINKIEYPDMLVFDLDPDPQISWKKIVSAALEIKKIFEQLDLKSFVKTTGGKGLHVVIPIKPQYEWREVKDFSKLLVTHLAMNAPEKYVTIMAKSKRHNKIFIDYLRNQRGATAIAPYSLRARKYAPIATPIAWDELTHDIRDTLFNIKSLSKRLKDLQKDPWADFFKIKQSLASLFK